MNSSLPKHSAENLTAAREDHMSRKGTLLIIAGIVLIVVVAGIVKLQGTKRRLKRWRIGARSKTR
jgi:hypothetical protein